MTPEDRLRLARLAQHFMMSRAEVVALLVRRAYLAEVRRAKEDWYRRRRPSRVAS